MPHKTANLSSFAGVPVQGLSQYQASNLPGVDLQVDPLRQPGQARVSRADV
jgi:hypothetical protein